MANTETGAQAEAAVIADEAAVNVADAAILATLVNTYGPVFTQIQTAIQAAGSSMSGKGNQQTMQGFANQMGLLGSAIVAFQAQVVAAETSPPAF